MVAYMSTLSIRDRTPIRTVDWPRIFRRPAVGVMWMVRSYRAVVCPTCRIHDYVCFEIENVTKV